MGRTCVCTPSETVYELCDIASSAPTLPPEDGGEVGRAEIQFGTKGAKKEQKKEMF